MPATPGAASWAASAARQAVILASQQFIVVSNAYYIKINNAVKYQICYQEENFWQRKKAQLESLRQTNMNFILDKFRLNYMGK